MARGAIIVSVRAAHYCFFFQRQFLATVAGAILLTGSWPVPVRPSKQSGVSFMAEECPPTGGGVELWLPDEFLDDDFFSEEEKAAVAARSENDDEEEGADGLPRRRAGLVVGNAKGQGDGSPANVGHLFCCGAVFAGFRFRISLSSGRHPPRRVV